MQGPKDVRAALDPGMHVSVIDISDAYFHVSIHKKAWFVPYYKFKMHRGTINAINDLLFPCLTDNIFYINLDYYLLIFYLAKTATVFICVKIGEGVI